MTTRAALTKAQMTRALEAWQKACGPVGAIEVLPDGRLRIEAPVDRARPAPQDDRKPIPWT